MCEKYLPGGSLNPYWVLNQKQQINAKEEAELEEGLMEALESCSVDPDAAMIEMCKLVPFERVPITLDEELETKFNFIKRHSDNPEDLQLAREIAGLPK